MKTIILVAFFASLFSFSVLAEESQTDCLMMKETSRRTNTKQNLEKQVKKNRGIRGSQARGA